MARKPKNKKIMTPRRGTNAAKIAEERNVGLETVDWSNVKDFDTAFRDTLRHYGYFYDMKDGIKWASAWVKKNYTKAQYENFIAADTWRVSMTACSLCKMLNNGAPLDDQKLTWLKGTIQEAIDSGKEKRKDKRKASSAIEVKRKSPADVVKERTSDFIAEIEYVLDDWSRGVWLDIDEYSVYNELQKIEAPYILAKHVADYYTPLRDELHELVNKKTPDLVEGYDHMSVRKRRELLRLVNSIVEDSEKYMAAKKVTRKPRAKKSISTAQIVSKVKYLKDSTEFKIASVDPAEIVGAKIVWLFNVRYRTLTRMESSSSANGMTVKGTTIQDFDEEKCIKKTIRKPDIFFASTAKTTKAKIDREFKALKTKEAASTGRLGEDTIIYKVFK